MKNKWIKGIVIIILGAFIVNIGNTIGGFAGNLITIFGAVCAIYGIVELFRKQKSA